MKKYYVIQSTPVKLPVLSTVLISFLLHYYKVDNIWWGIFITIYSILWIGVIARKFNEKFIDLNSDNPITEKEKQVLSAFMKRVQDRYNSTK